MARNWDSLSEPYRHRLERGGIDREAYTRGESLSAVRGHGLTRKDLIDQIYAYKLAEHGSKSSFRAKRAYKNIGTPTDGGKPRSKAQLQSILNAFRVRAEGRRYEGEDRDDFLDADRYH